MNRVYRRLLADTRRVRAARRVAVLLLPADTLPPPAQGLTATEAVVNARFQSGEGRQAHRLGRMLTRWLCYGDGRQVPFQYGPQGKPFLPGAPGFNLSHSGGWLALVLGDSPDLGIDIEAGARLGDGADLVPRVLHPLEAAAWHAAPDRRGLFLRAWTRKEALLKAKGTGTLDDFPLVDTRLMEEAPRFDGVRVHPLPGPLIGTVAIPEGFGTPEFLAV